MKLIAVVAFLFVTLTTPARAAETDWTTQDTVLQVAYGVLHVVDWTQTRQIAQSNGYYYEINPLIGKYPTSGDVDRYMMISGILHPIISCILPKPYRTYWQGATLTLKVGLVANNFNIGLTGIF